MRVGFARWARSELATGVRISTPLSNFAELKKCFDQTSVAFELAYGRIRIEDPSPPAQTIVRKFLELLWDVVRGGAGFIKTWCHERRHLACTGQPAPINKGTRRHPALAFGRGVEPEALIVASGLDRSWVHEATDQEKQEALDSAFDRLTAPKKVLNSDRRRDVLRFTEVVAHRGKRIGIREVTDEEVRTFVPLPGPQGTACQGSSVLNGGQKHAVEQWMRQTDDFRGFKVMHVAITILIRKRLYRELDAYAEADVLFRRMTGPRPAGYGDRGYEREGLVRWNSSEFLRLCEYLQWVERRLATLRSLVDECSRAQPGAWMSAALRNEVRPNRFTWPRPVNMTAAAQAPAIVAEEACRRCKQQLDDGQVSSAKLEVFQSVTGKLRLATVHEPHIVLAARAMTRFLISSLRNIRTNKAMLRNEVITLRDGDGRIIYSGDWSKATDHIGSDTATIIVTRALATLGAPEWMVDAVPAVCGHMELSTSDGRSAPLTCGALMGLGVSWFVMSILNDYCATRAGGTSHDFAVNGDDLVACWSPTVCDAYEVECTDIGIVVNYDKSFRGRLGVFCEQIVQREASFDGKVYRGRLVRESPLASFERERISTSIVGRGTYRLGECAGVKSIEGLKGHLVSDRLREISEGRIPAGFLKTLGPVRALAKRTLHRVALHRRLPGRLSQGGGGLGRANEVTFKAFVQGGPTSLRTKRKTAQERLETQLRLTALKDAPPPRPNGPRARLADLQVVLAVRDNGMADLNGAWRLRARAKSATLKDHRKRLTCRHNVAAKSTVGGVLASAESRARWGAKARSVAYAHAARGRFDKAISYLKNHTRLIDAECIPDVTLQPRRLREVEANRGLQPGAVDLGT